MTGDQRARVAGQVAVYAVAAYVCHNPDCPCEVVTLRFRVAGVPRHQRPPDVQLDVDLAKGVVTNLGPGGTEADALALALAPVVGGGGGSAPRAALLERRRRIRLIPATLAEYARNAEMVPYAHVLGGAFRNEADTWGYLDRLETAELSWIVMDYICLRAACRCEQVRLSFAGFGAEGGEAKARFSAMVSFGKAVPTLDDLNAISLQGAKGVYAAWKASTSVTRKTLRARYDAARAGAAKGAAKRAAKGAAKGAREAPERALVPELALLPAPVSAPPAAPPPLGRREPCPCGSGKRYKNCCGREGR